MKSFLRLLLLIGLHVSQLHAADEQSLPPKTASGEFLKLRMEFAVKPGYFGTWESDPAREALLELHEGKPDEFISKSAEWLKKCPVDAKIHLMRAGLLLKSGDVEGHFYHRLMYYGLTTSIVASGDGKTAKTAWKVISVDEEYTILNHLGADLDKQSLQYPCDVMEVKIEGQPVTLYFDVSIPLKAQERILDTK